MLKKTTLATLSLAISSFANAGMYSAPPVPTCVPGDVTVPCEARLWDIGVQALYLKPVYSSTRALQTSTTGGLREVEPKWGWGYRLEGSYHFQTGNDLTMNWMHYDVDSHLGLFGGTYLQLLPSPFRPLVLPASYSEFLNNKFDQVNLVLGQHVDVSLRDKARFYAGMQYANIRLDGQRVYNISPLFLAGTSGVVGTDNTDFNGAGPVIGVDYSYDLMYGLQVTANAAAALLYGTARYDNSITYGNGLVVSSLYNSHRKLVPSFEGKLGATYTHPLANGVVTIQGGYQIVDYFTALPASPLPGTLNLTNSDFSLYGPYFGIKWLGNA